MMAVLIGLAGALMLTAAYSLLFATRVEARWPARGSRVTAGPYDLHVVEAGRTDAAAPRVLLVHGAASDSHIMLYALEQALAPHAQITAIDRQGCGHSPGFGGRARLPLHADALAQLLRTQDGPPPVVVGHSYGAAVALRLALDHPDMVQGVVAICPASHGYVGPVSWYNYLAATPLIGRVVTRCIVPWLGPLMLGKALNAGFAPQTPPEGYRTDTGLDLLFRPASFRANALDLVAANRELAIQELRYGGLQTPLAVIAGAEDPTVYTQRHAVPLAAAAPDARLAIVPGVGHQAQLAATDLVVEHVRALLAEAPTLQAAS